MADIDALLEGAMSSADAKSQQQQQTDQPGDEQRAEPTRRRSRSPTADDRRRQRERDEITRDSRTVLVSGLHPKIDERDIFEFFSDSGLICDIHMIRDFKTGKSKGVSYIEFEKQLAVPNALALSGQLLGGYPITVQVTQSEKNRAAAAVKRLERERERPVKLRVENIDEKVTERDLTPMFAAFGDLEYVEIRRDRDGKSKGHGYIMFRNGTEGEAAARSLNGLDVLGKALKVQAEYQTRGDAPLGVGLSAPDYTGTNYQHVERLDNTDEGVQMSSQGRVELMRKLQREGGFGGGGMAPQITRCILLRNMFDPTGETSATFDQEIKEDVEEECSKFGKVLHIWVDRNSEGYVYMKMGTPTEGQNVFNNLNGRWFAQKQIIAQYIAEDEYSRKFPHIHV